MNLLKKELEKLIPEAQQDIKTLIKNKGESQISTVSVAQAYSGLRGIKAFVCDTSSVSADKGLIIRGYPLLDIVNILPEEVFYLLLTGRLPNKEELSDLQGQYSMHSKVPNYVWSVLEKLPKDTHPMTMFNLGILAMQNESIFQKKYD
ncbi:MAG: citrate/2-methylcitrate synthase, partial [Candidatus Marinimicrobia bacterium]|nr:citrate/2-methylcitrate synthase [Candidatus Neomarinimicrobiota bacterium]